MKIIGTVVAVFTLAVLIRLSSCYESFWIDELHTAWAVAGGFGDVAPRAALGNQMPVYFWGIWIWQQAFGDGEFALRLTSVLAVAFSAAWLCVVVHRQSGSLISGALSGVIIAIESNSLWFGTELRPYAVIILVSSVALGATLRLIDRHAADRGRQQLVLTGCLIAGVLLQPTSVGVLLWMPACLIGLSMWRRRSWWPRFSIGVLAQGITLIAVLLWAWRFTLQSSWQVKDNWAAFAVPTWIGPYWQIWPWWTLVILPLAMAAWWRFAPRISPSRIVAICSANEPLGKARSRSERPLWIGLLLGIAAMGITLVYWAVAYLEWIPLWHRRYLIAVLPMIAAVPGLALSDGPIEMKDSFFGRDRHGLINLIVTFILLGMVAAGITFMCWALGFVPWIPHWHVRYCIVVFSLMVALSWLAEAGLPRLGRVGIAVVVVAALMALQKTWPSVENPSRPMVLRNEAWREAVVWLGEQVAESERVYLDAGLIEARLLVDETVRPELSNYLTYPIRGPYGNGTLRANTAPIARSLLLPLNVLGSPGSRADRIWIVSRRNMRSMRAALKRSLRRSGPFDYDGVRLTSFGNVTIAEVPRLKQRKRGGWFGWKTE